MHKLNIAVHTEIGEAVFLFDALHFLLKAGIAPANKGNFSIGIEQADAFGDRRGRSAAVMQGRP